MAQWYAQIGGQQYGPVSEEELRQWIAQGRVRPGDLVWGEGMPGWVPASQAFPTAFAPGAAGAPPLYAPPAGPVVPPLGGTCGNTPNTDLMSQAWQAMKGRWGIAIGFTILLGLITCAAQMIPYVGGLAGLIIGGAFAMGASIFFLNYVRGGPHNIGMLFVGFNWFGTALATYLLVALFTLLWTLLLIVPGIIASLAYSQTFFLLADNPQLSPMDAIRRSKGLMQGHKWKMFCLGLWFFLLVLGCALTCFIGMIWLGPYMHVTRARFYDDLAPPPAGVVAVAPQPAPTA